MAYHVFLSFRGEETRNTFTSHLYAALTGAGFRTFLDDDGIESGANVKSALDKAINEARSSIVVLSKDYASSGWCLDELVMILNRNRTSSGAGHFVLLPVFYHVDPSQVRKQTGDFGEVLRKHEERLINAETSEIKKECLREKVQGWRRALKEVADLAGEPLQADGNESKFIQKIVGVVQKSVKQPVLQVARYLVGLESQAKTINLWLQDESINVGIAMIHGMGGIGKTTIAKYTYNLNAEQFEASSFLANVRENSRGPQNLVRMQMQLLSDILKRGEEIRNVDEGIGKIQDLIRCRRVLVVLDDVDDREQFDALIGKRDWFHPGSKIILTTRNKHLLMANEVDETFEVMGLKFDESLELFSWHAFKQSHPVEDYTSLSKRVVRHCGDLHHGGLPLALEVLGSFLSDRSSDFWESTILKLAAIPDRKILEKLKISYDYLDNYEKELFLHVACFFIGKGKNFIVRILGDLHPRVGIQTLIDRCLLTIDGPTNKLMMHPLIQQMGIEIVCRESPDEPGKRSRLCHHGDSFEVLSEKTGTETIKGIYLDMHCLLQKDSHHEQGYSRKWHCNSLSSWHPTNNGGRSADHVELTTDAFIRMHNLKLLQLNNVEIKGSYANFPGGLIYLSWHGFPLTSIPAKFSLKRLVSLDLRYSKLEQVWNEEVLLASLKVLNLSHCYGLKNTPKFTWLPILEKLVLEYCISLVEIDESIGSLESLVLLNLTGCKNLEKLPRGIGNLISLEKLILSNCSKLSQLPMEFRQMKSLTELHADGIFQETSLIRSLALKPRLQSLPDSLVRLCLSNCNLSSVADCFGSLSSLSYLDMSENPISNLPASIKGLAKLLNLDLRGCKRLKSLPELPMTIFFLSLGGCSSLETMKNLPNPRALLDLNGDKVVEVQGMLKLEPIENADAKIIDELGLWSGWNTTGNFELKFYNPLYGDNPTYGPYGQQLKKSTIQVLHECGIHSIFLPRSTVPASWSSNNTRMGSSITFKVPSPLNLKIQALKVCVVYESRFSVRSPYWGLVFITLYNKTKGIKWAYTPWFMGLPPDGSWMDVVWLSYWKMGNQFVLEAGDEVDVSAGFRGVYIGPPIANNVSDNERVMVFGVDVVYDEPEEKGSQHYNAYSHHQNVTNSGDLSAYQLRPGHYNLCNFDIFLSLDPTDRENIFGEFEDIDYES